MMFFGRNKRQKVQFLFAIGFLVLLLYYGYTKINEQFAKSVVKPVNQKVILAWTLFFDKERSYDTAEECDFKCFVTYDRSYLSHADLIILHQWDIKFWDLPSSNAPKVFFTEESPMFKKFKYLISPSISIFNYSMSYREDSDVVWPYDGRLMYAGKKRNQSEIEKIISKKTKLALSARSNCNTNSKRELLIDEMGKYVNVTTIGKCGETCDWECLDRLMVSHHFYLAFENAICEDYVTEKFFRFTSYIVPIVLRRHIIPQRIPSNVFIAVDDFKNIDDFTNYLTYLTKNHTAYASYFDWAITGKMAERYPKQDPGCSLCELAHTQPKKTIDDYNSVINDTKYCDNTFVQTFLGI